MSTATIKLFSSVLLFSTLLFAQNSISLTHRVNNTDREAMQHISNVSAENNKSDLAKKYLSLSLELDDVYKKVYKNCPPNERKVLIENELDWQKRVEACKGEQLCVDRLFETHISHLQIASGSFVVPEPVLYTCSDRPGDVLTVYFYNHIKLPVAVVNHIDDQFELYLVPSDSGSKYEADGVMFWEHHREAVLEAKGKTLHCNEKVISKSS